MHTCNHLGAGGGIGGSQEPGGAIWGILHLKQGPPTSLFGPTLSLRPCRVTSCPGSNPTTYFHPVLARCLKNVMFYLRSYLRFIISWLCVFNWWEYIFCCCRRKVYLSWIRIYLCLLFAIFCSRLTGIVPTWDTSTWSPSAPTAYSFLILAVFSYFVCVLILIQEFNTCLLWS